MSVPTYPQAINGPPGGGNVTKLWNKFKKRKYKWRKVKKAISLKNSSYYCNICNNIIKLCISTSNCGRWPKTTCNICHTRTKLTIWQLRTQRPVIPERIRPIHKTPRRIKKTPRRFASNAETFCLKHQNVFLWCQMVNFNKISLWQMTKDVTDNPPPLQPDNVIIT